MIVFLCLLIHIVCAQTISSPTVTIIAIGDLHADLDAAKNTFHMANITNEMGKWTRENVIVVQTGDLTDRGPDGLETLQWITELEKQAPKYNSSFHVLIGNHEAMNIVGDWRYVSREDVAGFGGAAVRKKAFSKDGEWRDWILQHDAVVEVQGNVFVHGGVSPTYAKEASLLSAEVVNALRTGTDDPILRGEGPLWYRGYFLNDEAIACAEVEQVLRQMNAQRMIMGHTTQRSGKIISRCKGKIVGIDTGVSSHYGGNYSAIEIQGNQIYAIYPDKKILLPTDH